MNGKRRYTLPLSLTAVAVLALGIAACGNNGDPEDVTLGEIVQDHDGFNGDTIRVEGEVVGFDEPVEHYVVEDQHQNRIELQPTDRAAEYEGETIVVVGDFTFSEDEGRQLEIEQIEVR